MVPTLAVATKEVPTAGSFRNRLGGQDCPGCPRLVVNNTKRNAEAARQLAKVLENRENGVFTPW
jgi:hypothetical protein